MYKTVCRCLTWGSEAPCESTPPPAGLCAASPPTLLSELGLWNPAAPSAVLLQRDGSPGPTWGSILSGWRDWPLLPPVLSANVASEFKNQREMILTFPRAARRFFGILPRGLTAPSGPFPALFPPGLPCVAAQPPLTIPHLSAGLQHARWNNHTISIMLLLQLQRTTVHSTFLRPKHLDGTMSPLHRRWVHTLDLVLQRVPVPL